VNTSTTDLQIHTIEKQYKLVYVQQKDTSVCTVFYLAHLVLDEAEMYEE